MTIYSEIKYINNPSKIKKNISLYSCTFMNMHRHFRMYKMWNKSRKLFTWRRNAGGKRGEKILIKVRKVKYLNLRVFSHYDSGVEANPTHLSVFSINELQEEKKKKEMCSFKLSFSVRSMIRTWDPGLDEFLSFLWIRERVFGVVYCYQQFRWVEMAVWDSCVPQFHFYWIEGCS